MRTLIIVEPGPVPIPPEAILQIMEAALEWRERWRAKMESFEFFAGRGGGWGVFNTADEIELSQAMMEMPFAPFSVVQVHPTLDGDQALQRSIENVKQVAAAMGGPTQ